MYSVTCRGVDDSLWNLAGPARGAEGAQLVSLTELVGAVSAATTPGPGRIGVRRTGSITVPQMAGSFAVVLCGADASPAKPTHDVLRGFRRAWSQLDDCELALGSSGSPTLRTLARLSDPLPPWAVDPYDNQHWRHSLTVSIVSDTGYWSGPPQPYAGGPAHEIYNPGDLEVWPVVSWTGPGPTITGPGVAPLVLPNAPAGATIDLDPATGTVITVDGEPAPQLWSQLRGRSFPTGIPPKGTAVWTFSAGASTTVTPRVLDPWSW